MLIQSLCTQINDFQVFQEEKRCIYQENNEQDWQVIQGVEMMEVIRQQQKANCQMKKLVNEGYFNLEGCQIKPIILDNNYGIEQISQDNMVIKLFQRCDQNTVREILLALEKDYSENELNYWKSCWTSAEKRKIWQEKVQNVDMIELTEILSKIPYQLSWVNKNMDKVIIKLNINLVDYIGFIRINYILCHIIIKFTFNVFIGYYIL